MFNVLVDQPLLVELKQADLATVQVELEQTDLPALKVDFCKKAY
jgi:hypothetical protein